MAYSHNGRLQSIENEWPQLHGTAWTCRRMNLKNIILNRGTQHKGVLITWLHICVAKSSKTKHCIFTCSYIETKILKKIKWNITKSKTGQAERFRVLKSTSIMSITNLGGGFGSILIAL